MEMDAIHNSEFAEFFKKTLSKYAPIKTKMSRYNNKPFMTKDLKKKIKLKNCFIKIQNPCKSVKLTKKNLKETAL